MALRPVPAVGYRHALESVLGLAGLGNLVRLLCKKMDPMLASAHRGRGGARRGCPGDRVTHLISAGHVATTRCSQATRA
jgi:hypothetical protein